jgi:putative ABC transport system permease protein
MFRYYLSLGWRSMLSSPAITCLMVIAMGMGIAACMTTLTVLHALSGDPLPGRSAQLFRPQIEPRPQDSAREDPPELMTYTDAMALLAARRGSRQVALAATALAVHPDDASIRPFNIGIRVTSSDFFTMFGAPFLYGGPWTSDEDTKHTRVAIISAELNQHIFRGSNSVGKVLRIRDVDFRVVGVMAPWRPAPRFYDLSGGNFSKSDDAYIPLSVSRDMRAQPDGSVVCWDSNFDPQKLETAPCGWVQFWVELKTPADVTGYSQFLTRYSQQQHDLGRFEQPPKVRLPNLTQWLNQKKTLPGDVTLQVWIAFAFLLVCTVNTSGLLLSKFLRRSGEMTVRRALGASRRDIFIQVLVEAGLVGVVGGVFGMLLSCVGLFAVRRTPVEYADLASLDPLVLVSTMIVMFLFSMAAALIPAWQATRASMALQLKAA